MVVGELIDILSGEQKYLHRKLERHIKTVVSSRGLRPFGPFLPVVVYCRVFRSSLQQQEPADVHSPEQQSNSSACCTV